MGITNWTRFDARVGQSP